MAKHNELGNKGEDLAAKHLVENGYLILDRNWRSGNKELDIVATKGNMLIVAEVKTRSTDSFEHPEEAINTRKIKNIISAAEAYIFERNIMMETRFDIVAVVPLPDGSFRIDHTEDAFISPVF